MKLIVGLGNPGSSYANNRHNIGFMCLSAFAKQHNINFNKKQGRARTGTGDIAGHPVILARPQTYMNASGQAVDHLVQRYKVNLADLMIIHDDIDLPLGKIRIKQGGGAGGHHGIESVIDWLENPDFVRMRIGVGRPAAIHDDRDAAVINFVLNNFSEKEKQVIIPALTRALDALNCWITEGLAPAMNKFNRNNETAVPD